MNPDPDYSAAYVILQTDAADLCGYGMTFTIGRGNELCIAAIHSLAPLLVAFQDHLHEHLCDPVNMRDGRYQAPLAPGYCVRFTESAIGEYACGG